MKFGYAYYTYKPLGSPGLRRKRYSYVKERPPSSAEGFTFGIWEAKTWKFCKILQRLGIIAKE